MCKKSEMFRLKDETRLVLEVSRQHDVAQQCNQNLTHRASTGTLIRSLLVFYFFVHLFATDWSLCFVKDKAAILVHSRCVYSVCSEVCERSQTHRLVAFGA